MEARRETQGEANQREALETQAAIEAVARADLGEASHRVEQSLLEVSETKEEGQRAPASAL